MNKVLRFLGPIFAGVVRSLLVSFIVFIIFFSVMTQKFPPKFDDLTQITQLTKQILEVPKNLNKFIDKSDDLAAIKHYEQLNKKRSQLSNELLKKLGQKGPSEIKEFDDIESQLRQINDRLERIELNLENLQHR